MENKESVFVTKGTNPLMTVLIFGAMITVLVTSGSYFSKQRLAARTEDDTLKSPVVAIASANQLQ